MARIYISSTYSDLETFREAVYRALRQLGHDAIAMEDYVATDKRPAAKCLADVAACDLYIGIFAWRYGSIPPGEERAITEMEYRKAHELDIPRLVFLLEQNALWSPQLMDAVTGEDKGTRITALREALGQEHLVSFFRSKEDLAQKVSVAVSNWRRDTPEVPAKATELQAHLTGLREAYLTWVTEQVRDLPLSGIDPNTIQEDIRRHLDLASVYTALMTQRTEGGTARDMHLDRDTKRLSALAVLNTESRLALLGDPGSGKSTFVNFIALCMAGELLDRSDANLAILTAPVPEDEPEGRGRDEAPPEPQPWHRGPLLPIRVILREFVARGLPPAGQSQTVSGDTLWQFIIAELPVAWRDEFADPLRRELLDIGGILLLDGLDEVPEAEQRRTQVKTVVEQFSATFPKMVVLATSRTYAYQNQDWKLNGFTEAVLAPFGQAQIRSFVERWYAYVGPARKLSKDDTEGRAAQLNHAITTNPRLYELATRPLLLTLMASLHAWRGGTLPDQRQKLYADAVELLLNYWESQKVQRQPDGTYEVIQPSLVEWLRVDQGAMRQTLNRLAFEAHRDQPALVGTADIAQNTLVDALMRLQQNPDVRPARLIEHLRDRAGLLEPRGVGIYAFPHRTFQEYLAACHLTDVGFPDDLAVLLRAEPNRWREVTLLAGAKAVGGTSSAAWTLADALCFEDAPEQKLSDTAGYWGALLAAQVLIENNSLIDVAERNRPKVERIRMWLVRTLAHNALSAVDRAQAGEALAYIGDPRFNANAWYLPDEPLLGFVEIPAGPFQLGSDTSRDAMAYDNEEPQHQITLPQYYIARYPVTVAQFCAFVDASGYEPEDTDSLRGLPNHPVVLVTWYDARKYCDWLTERLREWDDTPEPLATLLRDQGWQITLPSETEWEKAARGQDRRIYPWGDDPDPNRANYNDAGINTTSAVGCFPQGASPYRVEELSGNVWEWTRSLWGKDFMAPSFKYPYDPTDGREDPQASPDVLRVLRGGSFFYRQRLVCCASRLRLLPQYRFTFIGFRVVLLP